MNISIFDSVVLITHIVLLVAYILKNWFNKKKNRQNG
jgi:hypothetical protein